MSYVLYALMVYLYARMMCACVYALTACFQVCCTCLTVSASCSSCEGDIHLQCVVCDSGNWCFSPSHCMTDCVCCVILQAMDHEVLKEMEKALEGNKILETLRFSDGNDVTLPKEFCRHLMIGIGQSKSLSEVDLNFAPINWVCLNNGRLVYVSHMLGDSVGCSV